MEITSGEEKCCLLDIPQLDFSGEIGDGVTGEQRTQMFGSVEDILGERRDKTFPNTPERST